MPVLAHTGPSSKSHRLVPVPSPAPLPVNVWTHSHTGVDSQISRLASYALQQTPAPLSRHPNWLRVLGEGLGHRVHLLEARSGDATVGLLPLAEVKSLLFGKFLVSLPYLNSNGVIADHPAAATALVGKAVELADDLGVRYLELRHETAVEHPALTGRLTSKVHMRLRLPNTTELLWKQLDAKVRNQVRKGEKHGLTVSWGGTERMDDFYAVLCENMRDLGTPVYGRKLFATILRTFPRDAELCIVRDGSKPVAAGLLLHGPGVTEVPTASSLREYNPTCANMLMYRHLIDRAVERRQQLFDFGRSTLDSGTYRFKKQWGAEPHPAIWQYHARTGAVGEMRPDNPRYERVIRLWQKLPVRLTQILGPAIVRGIP